MDLVELWVLLKTRYEEHCYTSRKIAELQRQFPHVTSNINEQEIVTGIRSAYSGRKVTNNQAESLSIEYRNNIYDALEEAGKVPSTMHIHNIQQIEEYCTLSIWIKYVEFKFIKSGTTFFTKQQTDNSTLKT